MESSVAWTERVNRNGQFLTLLFSSNVCSRTDLALILIPRLIFDIRDGETLQSLVTAGKER
jgi:hypothetical protein